MALGPPRATKSCLCRSCEWEGSAYCPSPPPNYIYLECVPDEENDPCAKYSVTSVLPFLGWLCFFFRECSLSPSLLSFFFARKIPFYPLRPRKGVTTPPPQRLTPTPPFIILYLERGTLRRPWDWGLTRQHCLISVWSVPLLVPGHSWCSLNVQVRVAGLVL